MEPTTPPSVVENPIQKMESPELTTYIEEMLPPESILSGDWVRQSHTLKIVVKNETLTPASCGLKRKSLTTYDSPAQREPPYVESTSCTIDPLDQKLEPPIFRNLEGLIKDEMPDQDDAVHYSFPDATDKVWVEGEPSSEKGDEDIDQNDDFDLFIPEIPNTHSSHDGDRTAPEKTRQKTGPRAKTARDYRLLHPLKRKFSLAWKRDMVAKIKAEMPNAKKSSKKIMVVSQRKTRKRNRNGQRTAGKVLDSLLNASVSAPEADADTDTGPLPDILVTQKGEFLNKLLAKFPHLDLHKCKGEYNDLIKKSRTFGYQRVKKDGNGWRLQSMKTPLHNHQLTGTAWMVERECSEEGPHGGILADDVGVGKTLQAIALVVGNPATAEHESKGIKATLIVVPNRVLYQWKDEFVTHSNIRPWVYKNADENNEIERVCDNDVVLTTYHELKASLPYPSKAIMQRWKKDEQDIEGNVEDYIRDNMRDARALHRIAWYRIILDEAQTIKKHLGRFSRAAIALTGENRWALTATPIMNRCEEFYPLFNFIQDPFTKSYNFEKFCDLFCDATDSFSRNALEVALSDIIIRRQKHDKALRTALVSLPPSHKEDLEINMRPPERLLYRAVRKRLRELLSEDFDEGDPRKKLSTQLGHLTCLRQMVVNPDIIEPHIKVIFESEDLSDLQERLSELRLSAQSDVVRGIMRQRIETWIKEKRDGASDPALAPEKGACCSICNDEDDDLVYLVKCRHIFCKSCIEENSVHDVEDDDAVELCPLCEKSFNCNQKKPLNPPAKGVSERFSYSQKRAKDARGFRPMLIPSQAPWLRKFDEGALEVFPSAKLVKAMEILRQWHRDAPGEKVIIFAQWKPFLVMAGFKILEQNQKFVYFTGDMTLKQQSDAIFLFRGSPEINVMLASLKAGGTGLNFQFANRMIIIDLWWNTAAEAQALGRIERWGQTRETHCKKLITANSIDTAVFELQKSKDTMIARLMKDNLDKLSIRDMATLLGGQVREDENGHSTIVYDDDDDNDDADLNDADDDDSDTSASDDE